MTDEDLITLKDASEIIFGGRVSPATLKDQWRRGNLDLSKIGRSYFASVADFKGLKTKCLVERPARASGSTRKEEPGLSSTVEAAAARRFQPRRAGLMWRTGRRPDARAGNWRS
jgi:hypothetical protein